MPRTRSESLATRQAQRLIQDEGLTTLPIDPIALAMSRGIEVVEKHAPGASGMLISIPGENLPLIAYATHIANEGFQRFSIAHELGHYFLDGHIDHLLGAADVHVSHAGFGSDDRCEREADEFATGLLLPETLFIPAMGRAGSGFSAIESLADLCVTSITATAIRYAQLADDPVAIVMSTENRIDFWFASEAFKQTGVEWLKKGDLLPQDTATAKFNEDEGRIASGARWEQSTRIPEWFGDGPNRALSEDVIGLGTYGKTLTVLFPEDHWPDVEDDDDEELGEWNPKFHRSRRR